MLGLSLCCLNAHHCCSTFILCCNNCPSQSFCFWMWDVAPSTKWRGSIEGITQHQFSIRLIFFYNFEAHNSRPNITIPLHTPSQAHGRGLAKSFTCTPSRFEPRTFFELPGSQNALIIPVSHHHPWILMMQMGLPKSVGKSAQSCCFFPLEVTAKDIAVNWTFPFVSSPQEKDWFEFNCIRHNFRSSYHNGWWNSSHSNKYFLANFCTLWLNLDVMAIQFLKCLWCKNNFP